MHKLTSSNLQFTGDLNHYIVFIALLSQITKVRFLKFFR